MLPGGVHRRRCPSTPFLTSPQAAPCGSEASGHRVQEGALGVLCVLEEVPSQAFPDPDLSPCPSTELHSKLQSSEVEVKSKCEELSNLHGQLQEAKAENLQLTERIRSIETLLGAGQAQITQVSHFSGQSEERVDSAEQRASSLAQFLHL